MTQMTTVCVRNRPVGFRSRRRRIRPLTLGEHSGQVLPSQLPPQVPHRGPKQNHQTRPPHEHLEPRQDQDEGVGVADQDEEGEEHDNADGEGVDCQDGGPALVVHALDVDAADGEVGSPYGQGDEVHANESADGRAGAGAVEVDLLEVLGVHDALEVLAAQALREMVE